MYKGRAEHRVKCYSKAQQDFPIKSSRKINKRPVVCVIVKVLEFFFHNKLLKTQINTQVELKCV